MAYKNDYVSVYADQPYGYNKVQTALIYSHIVKTDCVTFSVHHHHIIRFDQQSDVVI